jgi:hypothetical protein
MEEKIRRWLIRLLFSWWVIVLLVLELPLLWLRYGNMRGILKEFKELVDHAWNGDSNE